MNLSRNPSLELNLLAQPSRAVVWGALSLLLGFVAHAATCDVLFPSFADAAHSVTAELSSANAVDRTNHDRDTQATGFSSGSGASHWLAVNLGMSPTATRLSIALPISLSGNPQVSAGADAFVTAPFFRTYRGVDEYASAPRTACPLDVDANSNAARSATVWSENRFFVGPGPTTLGTALFGSLTMPTVERERRVVPL